MGRLGLAAGRPARRCVGQNPRRGGGACPAPTRRRRCCAGGSDGRRGRAHLLPHRLRFLLVNPNTGTAPIFRTRRDAELTTAIYRRLPVLVDRSTGAEKKAWPVRYMTMFHMTNDSGLFWTRERLEQDGAYPSGMGRWRKGDREWVPLYEGKMVQAFSPRTGRGEACLAATHRPRIKITLTHAEHY